MTPEPRAATPHQELRPLRGFTRFVLDVPNPEGVSAAEVRSDIAQMLLQAGVQGFRLIPCEEAESDA